MWLLSISKTSDYELTEFSEDETLPDYAILSHTWLQPAIGEAAYAVEPTFRDLRQGKGREKPGYAKIHFCGQQAKEDKLEYFWVDTCCINKIGRASCRERVCLYV